MFKPSIAALAAAILLSGCVGTEVLKTRLPDGTDHIAVTDYVKQPLGPNTQTVTVYRCAEDVMCVPLRSETTGSAGPLDALPQAAAAGAADYAAAGVVNGSGGSNVSVSATGGSSVANATGGSSSAGGEKPKSKAKKYH